MSPKTRCCTKGLLAVGRPCLCMPPVDEVLGLEGLSWARKKHGGCGWAPGFLGLGRRGDEGGQSLEWG